MSLQITPKKFQLYIKQGHNVESLTRFLNISEEELDKAMGKFAKGKALRDMHRELNNNPGVKKYLTTEPEDFDENKAEIQEEVAIDSDADIEVESEVTSSPASEKISLEEVLQRIEKCKKDIFQIETLHQEKATKRSQAKVVLLNTKKEISETLKRLDTLNEIIDNNMKIYEENGEEMQKLSTEKKQLKKDLKKLEETQVRLETVSIFVFEDGNIAIDNASIDIPETWKEIHQQLYGEEALDLLTGVQAKAISKILAFLKTLDKKYEIILASDEMQRAFDTLKMKII